MINELPENTVEEHSIEGINHDQLLDGMLQGDVSPDIEAAEIEATQTRLVEAVQMTLPGLNPVTVIDHPPGRAVRQASLAAKTSWRSGNHRGGQTERLYYVADNGIEISLGTRENPLDLEEAKQQIKKAGELTVLIDRLIFWYWLSRSRPRPGDGKTFVGRNGSVPISIEEMLTMLGYTKHAKRETSNGRQYTDGFRTEDKDKLLFNIHLLAAFQVSSNSGSSFDIQGAYLRYSLGFWQGTHTGYLISPGDWINTITLPDELPALMSIDQQIFQFDRQRQQPEIRLCLYLAEAFRDQFREGTLGTPLMTPVHNSHSRKSRYITMEELLSEAKIRIDRNNLTQRFVPRIEEALKTLVDLNILAYAELASPVDRTQGYWGKTWCNAPIIIQAPAHLVKEYRSLQQPTVMPPLLGPGKGRKRAKK